MDLVGITTVAAVAALVALAVVTAVVTVVARLGGRMSGRAAGPLWRKGMAHLERLPGRLRHAVSLVILPPAPPLTTSLQNALPSELTNEPLLFSAPAWSGGSSRTPAWMQDSIGGGRTPAYRSDMGRTANPYAEGSRTSYGGGSVRFTPLITLVFSTLFYSQHVLSLCF